MFNYFCVGIVVVALPMVRLPLNDVFPGWLCMIALWFSGFGVLDMCLCSAMPSRRLHPLHWWHSTEWKFTNRFGKLTIIRLESMSFDLSKSMTGRFMADRSTCSSNVESSSGHFDVTFSREFYEEFSLKIDKLTVTIFLFYFVAERRKFEKKIN